MRTILRLALAAALVVAVAGSVTANASPTRASTHIDRLQWSPDGRWLAFTVRTDEGRRGVRVVRRDSGVERQVVWVASGSSISDLAWSPDSRRLAFTDGVGTTWVSLADGRGLRRFDGVFGDWSPTSGQLLLAQWQPSSISILDLRTGAARRLVTGSWPKWSPDGQRVAFTAVVRRSAVGWIDTRIFSVDTRGGDLRQLSSDDRTAWSTQIVAGWAPDSRRLAYTEWRGSWSDSSSFVVQADGSRQELALGAGSPTWSPGGRRLAVHHGSLTFVTRTGWQLSVFEGVSAWSWSPGGQRVAYTVGSDDTAYVARVDGTGRPRRLGLVWEHWVGPAWSSLGWIALVSGTWCGERVLLVRPNGEGYHLLTRCPSG